jgi:spore germination protein KC
VNGEYEVTTQVINPAAVTSQQSGGTNQPPVFTYQTKSKTLTEALQKRMSIGSRVNYTSQLKVLVIGENLAREGINEFMDYLSRSSDLEPTFYIVISKNKTAAQLLNTMSPIEKSPADTIYSSIQTLVKTKGTVLATTTDDLLMNITNEGEEVKLTGIELLEEQKKEQSEDAQKKAPKTILKTNSISAFHNDKLIGWLSEDASKGLVMILNKTKSTVISVPCPKNPKRKLAMEIVHTKTKVKGFVKNDHPEIRLKVRSELNINESQCKDLDITNPEDIQKLNVLSQQEIKRILSVTLLFAQKKYKTDILQFGRAIYRGDMEYWAKNKTNWDRMFINLPVTIQSEVKISFTGTTQRTMTQKSKGYK